MFLNDYDVSNCFLFTKKSYMRVVLSAIFEQKYQVVVPKTNV